jgi:hypothetical protein
MKKLSLLLFLVFNLVSCQNKVDKSNSKSTINIEEFKPEIIGFSDKYDKLPKLDIQKINVEEFNNLIIVSTDFTQNLIKEKEGNYLLEVDSNILQLNRRNKKEGGNWYSYLGFYTPLNMYSFSSNSTSEGLNFSDFELINKSNGKIIKILSPSDDRIENPILSYKADYLTYYHNQVYEGQNSFLGVVKIDLNKNLKEYKSITFENFKIYQIGWSKDNYILFKVSSDDGKSFQYYKSNVLSSNTKVTLENNDDWTGTFYIEISNRDKIKTIFNITVKSLNNVSVSINEDGSNESYSNIKAEIVNEDKIKIIYNPTLEDEMGIIYLEKSDNSYFISGTPIYMINPGSNEREISKK